MLKKLRQTNWKMTAIGVKLTKWNLSKFFEMGPFLFPTLFQTLEKTSFVTTGIIFEYLMDSNAKASCYICKSKI